MKNLLGWLADAIASVVGWIVVIGLTVVIGFTIAYSVGHREFMGLQRTLQASVYLPVIWITFPWMLAAYATTVLAIYLPLRMQSLWLYIAAPMVNLAVWIVIVESIVRFLSSGKFWQW